MHKQLIHKRKFCIREREGAPIRYGWVQPITSHNPLRIVFQQWMNIVADLRKAKSARDVFGYLFAPPGWQPDGNGPTTANLRRQTNRVATESIPIGDEVAAE